MLAAAVRHTAEFFKGAVKPVLVVSQGQASLNDGACTYDHTHTHTLTLTLAHRQSNAHSHTCTHTDKCTHGMDVCSSQVVDAGTRHAACTLTHGPPPQ